MKLEVGYYAKCSQTGEVWFDPCCRNVYNAVLRSFRADMHEAMDYDCRMAAIRYCVLVDGSEFLIYDNVCYIYCSGANHHVNTYIERE